MVKSADKYKTKINDRMSTSPSALNLLIVAHRFQRNDGQGRVNYEVALALSKRGFKVTALTAYCADEIASLPGFSVVRIGKENLPTQLLRNVAFANQSARWIREHRAEFDLVQGNGFITWEPCDIVTAHFVHTAWAKHPHYPFRRTFSAYDFYQRRYTSLNARWERRTFLRAKQIIAVSQVVAQDIEEMGVPPERIAVIHNGVDVQEFRPGPSERATFDLPADVPIALFVGDIRSPRKNLETLLRAMQAVPGLHLAVAGETEGSNGPARAASLGIQDRVHFLGKVKRVPDLMRSCDLFVFPSRYEAHPLVVLEAMASGMSMILSRNIESAHSFREVFEILEDPEDSSELSRLLQKLVSSKDLRNSMGTRARDRAMSLQWSNTTSAYLDVYERMAAMCATA